MISQLKSERKNLNHGFLEPNVSVLPMSYTDPNVDWIMLNLIVSRELNARISNMYCTFKDKLCTVKIDLN